MITVDIRDDRSERVKYDYPDLPVYIRRAFLSSYPNYAADSHWHSDIEMIAILSGQMLYNVNGKIITLNEGEGILVNSKQLHYGFSETKTECDFICILFHPLMLCLTKMFEAEFVNPILNSGVAYWHLSPKVHWQDEILKHIRSICDKKDDKAAPLHIQSSICLLWNEIITNTDSFSANGKSSAPKLTVLKKMIAYIHEHYSKKLTLADISAAGNISKRTCGTVFLEYQNKTPIEFLVDYRLRKSIELMKNTDMTILEISIAVGFSGASYYAETFKKCFGKSPAEYRKQL